MRYRRDFSDDDDEYIINTDGAFAEDDGFLRVKSVNEDGKC